jgi:predicted glycosyltransferase
MRKNLIHSAVLCFEPHLFLVDHMPHGAMGELLFTLESLKELKTGTCIVLGLRDILDSPEVIKQHWEEEGAYHALECFYDRVLVFGMQEVFDIAEQYQLPGAVKDLLRYTGYVCTPAMPRYTARARQQAMSHGREGVKMILVMAGGGADAYPMMRIFLDALPWVLENKPVAVMTVTGPFMPIEQRHELEASARGMPVKVRDKVSDILSYLDACDLVVSMAGYNSTIEILRSRKPAILLPRRGPSQEQRTRARLFADQHWVRFLDPLDVTPEILAQAVIEDLENGMEKYHSIAQKPNLDGANTAVDHLISMLPPELRAGNEQTAHQVITQSNRGSSKPA